MQTRSCINDLCVLLLLLTIWFPSTARGQSETFYKGKTVKFVVGSGAGAFYDAWGRLIARHWGKHIPGNPEVIVQNMVGASSLTATNFMFMAWPSRMD